MKTNKTADGDRSLKIKYFDELAPRWDDIMGKTEERLARLRDIFTMIDLPAGGRIIDAGCGTGILLPLIRERIGPQGRITALDASPVMMNKARENSKDDNGITFMVTPLEVAPLAAASYDAAFCFAVIPHLDDIAAGLSVLRKGLVTGGRLYIFHLDDTETLNRFHSGLDAPVKRDLLPAEPELDDLLKRTGFRMETYLDRPGLNFTASTTC